MKNSSLKPNLIGFVIALIALLLVEITNSNVFLFLKINSLSGKLPGIIWANITLLGDALVASLVMLLFIRKKPSLVWAGIVAALLATLFVHALKPIFDIQRPAAVIDNNIINLIGSVYHYRSFPSGHAATVFTLVGILFYYIRIKWINTGALILAILISISRIAVGVHWPTDILAGAAIGYLAAMLGCNIVSLLKWKENRIAQLIVGAVLIIAAFYLLLFYNSRYEHTILLQSIIAISILILGIREYYLILKS